MAFRRSTSGQINIVVGMGVSRLELFHCVDGDVKIGSCICVFLRRRVYVCIYIYIYIYVCVCVCVCMCVSVFARQRA